MRIISIMAIIAAINCVSFASHASSKSFEIEAGVLHTNNMEISGYQQQNATSGWKSNDATVRLEFWSKNDNGWNFGTILQPIYTRYSGTISENLNTKGDSYTKGELATLDYQFHSIRETANHQVLRFQNGGGIKLGGSLIARYAQANFTTASNSFHSSGFLVAPLINFEIEVIMTPKHKAIVKSDFLPLPTQGIMNGIYDTLFAVRTKLDNDKSFDVGLRLFFGGYDPQKADKYANRIFLSAFVVRYNI